MPHGGTPHCIDQVTPLFAGSSLTTATMFGSVPPNCTVDTGADTTTEIAFSVTVMDDCTAGSATEVAVTVMATSVGGGAAGAVYVVAAPLAVAVGDTLPQGADEHDRLQLTPL